MSSRCTSLVAALGGLCFVQGNLHAQWNLVEDASFSGGGGQQCVELTQAANEQKGAAWHDCEIHLDAPFNLSFSVNLGGNDGGADGMCFVLHQAGNTNGLVAQNGHPIGYAEGPFGSSLAVELDTWSNDGQANNGPVNLNDPWFDHLAILRNGINNHNDPSVLSPAVQAHPVNTNIEDGQDHSFQLTWDPTSTLFEVYFDGALRASTTLDIVNNIFGGDPMVNWGWTSSTGGANNAHAFCLEDAYYSTYVEAVGVLEDAPWEVCENGQLELTAEALLPGLNPSWVDTGTDLITIQTPGQYLLYAEDALGCPTHNEASVSGLPAPNLQLASGPDLVGCGVTEAVLQATADPGSSIMWDNLPGEELVTTVEGFHYAEAVLGECVETDSVWVLFQPIPDVSATWNGAVVTGTVEACVGEPLLLEAQGTLGSTSSWDGTNSDVQNVTASGSYVAVSEINGCESSPLEVTVEMLELPNGSFSSSPSVLCWNSSGQVGFVPNNGASLLGWSFPTGTNSEWQAGPGPYSVDLMGVNGCENTLTFTYNSLPPIQSGLVDPDPLCDESIAVLEVPGNVDDVSWNVGGNGTQLNVVSSMGGGPFVANVTLGNCAQSDTAWVTWWPTPNVGSHPDTVVKCVLDLPYSFNWPTQTEQAVGAWVWEVNTEPATAGYQAWGEGDYQVEIRDVATGCSDTHTTTVKVLPNLNVVAEAESPLICIGDSSGVVVELVPVNGTDPYDIPFSLEWSTDGMTGMTPMAAEGEHVVTVSNACGSDEGLVEITEEYCGCHLWIPNAFTPDNDGLNEGLKVVSSCEWDAFRFEVYNRWGQAVWVSEDQDQPWDGGADHLGGGAHYLPDGWYPYVVSWEYREKGVFHKKRKTGRILILR